MLASSFAIGRLVQSLKSLTGTLALLVMAFVSREAFAQDSWNFAAEIPCATAPVYGVPFNQCWVSNTRTFRVGNIRAWRLVYTDLKSEFAIGLYATGAAARGGVATAPRETVRARVG